jgi:hypothetical protein
MTRTRTRFAAAGALVLLLTFASSGVRAADPTPGKPAVALAGKVKQPGQFDLARLQSLPKDEQQVSYQTDHGPQQARFTGVLLWALIYAAGGLDDSDKSAALHHTIKITAQDGYFAILSTGEIAPDLGGKPALIAYQRGDEAPGTGGLRLVIPGDKHGARNVRDVVAIDVE